MLASWADVRPDLQRLEGSGMRGITFGGELDMSLVEKHRDLVVNLLGVRTLGEVAALSPRRAIRALSGGEYASCHSWGTR